MPPCLAQAASNCTKRDHQIMISKWVKVRFSNIVRTWLLVETSFPKLQSYFLLAVPIIYMLHGLIN